MSCFPSPGYSAWFFHSADIYIHQKSCKLSKCLTGHFLLCLSDLSLPWHFLSLFLCQELPFCSPFFPSHMPAGNSYSAMRCPPPSLSGCSGEWDTPPNVPQNMVLHITKDTEFKTLSNFSQEAYEGMSAIPRGKML